MMENTHNSELSSYTTPEGGTEENNETESEEVVSKREDDSGKEKNLETGSNGIGENKTEDKQFQKVENDPKDPSIESVDSMERSKDSELNVDSVANEDSGEEMEAQNDSDEPKTSKSDDVSKESEVSIQEIVIDPNSNSPENSNIVKEENKSLTPVIEDSEVTGPLNPEPVEPITKDLQSKELNEAKEEVVSAEKEDPATDEVAGSEPGLVKDIASIETKDDLESDQPVGKPVEQEEVDIKVKEEEGEVSIDEGATITSKKSKDDADSVISDDAKTSEGSTEKEQDQEISEGHDFSKYTPEQIVDLIKKLARYQDMVKAEKIVRRFNDRVIELKKLSKTDALKKFIEEGGEESDFDYKPDELFERIDANTKLIHDRKHAYIKNLERQKEENLAKAEVLLERLRDFLDGSESSSSFKVFKEIQTEWKTLGPLPGALYKSLWANYNALVNRFYDTRSIYFELKELDRKKNLEFKSHLCEKAELLDDVKDLKQAIIQLNELHDEFKHTGPVPLSDQETIWLRFKAASDKVYARRKVYNSELKHELKENLQSKSEIAEEISQFTEFSSDRIKEWNTKTREILELQKKWEKVGGLPREKAKDINKKFWSSFKSYFHNKNDFFKKLEGQRTENLKLKEELVKEADGLKNSEEWDDTAKKLKELQEKWKEIGPVPEKVRNEVYMRFKAPCDYFFEKKREKGHTVSQDYVVNLEKKKAIIAEINTLIKGDKNIEKLKELQYQFYEIGFVPKLEITKIQTEYNEALNEFIANVKGLDESEKQSILLENRVEKLRHSPNADKKIHQKEHNLKKQIGKIENDISIWRNNMEFFANTKNAEKLKSDFNKKIVEAANELERLKKELRVYKTA